MADKAILQVNLMHHHRHHRAADAEHQRLAQQRLLAREGINKASLLADVQPVPDENALHLPYQVKIAPTFKSYVFVSAIFILFSLPALACAGLLEISPVPGSYELAVGATVLVIIVLLVVAIMPIATRYTFILTKQQIEIKSFLNNRSLRWNEIALFAQDASSSPGPLRYEVSDEAGNIIVSWVIARGHWGDTYTVPSVPYDDYIQQMQQVLSFIAAKTNLPLYDLSKPYKESGGISLQKHARHLH